MRTFDPQTGCALGDRSQCMLNLDELPTWGEDRQGITRDDEMIKRLEWSLITCTLRRLRWPLIVMWGVGRDTLKTRRASVHCSGHVMFKLGALCNN